MKIFIDLKLQLVSKRKSWFSNEKIDNYKIVALSIIREIDNGSFTCLSTDFDEKTFVKTRHGQTIINLVKRNAHKLTNHQIVERLKVIIGKPEQLTVVSSGINPGTNKTENAIFHLEFGSKLGIENIEYIDLFSVIRKYESNLNLFSPPDDSNQVFHPHSRAAWVKQEYNNLLKRIEDSNLTRFEMVAQESHKGLLEYMQSKASYNENGDVVIPKNNFDNWMKKSTKPYFTLDKNQKHQYIYEANKYFKAINNGRFND